MSKTVLKENEIKAYAKKYNFKIFEIYLLNFILSKPHISEIQREVLVSKFIISCFESENAIGSDFYEVITILYKSFHNFVRSKDGCYTIDDYFNLYFTGFKNYDNLPLAINLFNGSFPFPHSYACNVSSVLFKTHNGGYILPLEARKLLFRIMCEASYTNLSLESFINTIFNIFLLDVDSKEFLLDKSEWKSIINTLIGENLLSPSKTDKASLRLLSPDEREIMILKEEKERKLSYLITSIKQASTFFNLNSIVSANDFKLLCDNTILKILFDKIYSLMQPKPTYSNFLDFICILYKLYNDKIINSTRVSKFIIKFLK